MDNFDRCFNPYPLGPIDPIRHTPDPAPNPNPRHFASDEDFTTWLRDKLNQAANHKAAEVVIKKTHKAITPYVPIESATSIVNHAVWGARIAIYGDLSLLKRLRKYVAQGPEAKVFVNEKLQADVDYHYYGVKARWEPKYVDTIITAQNYRYLLDYAPNILTDKTVSKINQFITSVNEEIDLTVDMAKSLCSYFTDHPYKAGLLLDVCQRAYALAHPKK